MSTHPVPVSEAVRVRRPVVAFVVVVFAVLIVSMDNSILFVTLKTRDITRYPEILLHIDSIEHMFDR